jgi:hypothetical protein
MLLQVIAIFGNFYMLFCVIVNLAVCMSSFFVDLVAHSLTLGPLPLRNSVETKMMEFSKLSIFRNLAIIPNNFFGNQEFLRFSYINCYNFEILSFVFYSFFYLTASKIHTSIAGTNNCVLTFNLLIHVLYIVKIVLFNKSGNF